MDSATKNNVEEVTKGKSKDEEASLPAQHTNRLAQAKSPYLLQHKHNPVDWHEWGPEAFSLAQKEEKPIFLSIGYSACHWCHVLAHESFEDEEISGIMNRGFINIKVDREERPDVDRLYMTFVSATNQGRGGWPLSVFLNPDLTPILGGTYFPPQTFASLLMRIHMLWNSPNRPKLQESGKDIIEQLKNLTDTQATTSVKLNPEEVEKWSEKLYQRSCNEFDEEWGGWGDAPKFPSVPSTFYPLIRHAYYAATSESNQDEAQNALRMVLKSLQTISEGGIHDHVGGGFCRYGVDREWSVPHFEKMLYDQPQLILSYLDASLLLQHPSFRKINGNLPGVKDLQNVVVDIAQYVLRDLKSPTTGAFYSSEDADSTPEGGGKSKEGAFYVWSKKQLDELLGERAVVFCDHFGVEENGNVSPQLDHQGEMTGLNTLKITQPLRTTATKHKKTPEEIQETLQSSLLTLKSHRDNHRVRPHLDDKIVVSTNALLISALSRVGTSLPSSLTFPTMGSNEDVLAGKTVREEAMNAARGVANWIKKEMWDGEKKELWRVWREGRGTSPGMGDDWAYLIQAMLDLYEAEGVEDNLIWADELQQSYNEKFWDHQDNNGYYTSPLGDPHLLVRLKDMQDSAEPSSSSVSISNLYRLAAFFPDRATDYESKAEQVIEGHKDMLNRAPHGFGTSVANARLNSKGLKQFIHTGPVDLSSPLLATIYSRFIPNHILVHIDPNKPPAKLAERNEVVKAIVGGKLEGASQDVRICEGRVCGLPIRDVEDLKKVVEGIK